MKDFKIEVTITEKEIRDDIITALEQGVGYWMDINEKKNPWLKKAEGKSFSEIFGSGILDGNTALLHDTEEPSKQFELTLDKLVKGYELYFNRKNHGLEPCFDIRDAEETDVIFQLAIFGDIVYG